ncbi:putative glypican-4 [Apostichopus japonicus]|uniref:Putative glypican-4 n=1 Tax=Stichopus japonicus TaxID=307972 RepID=A0A2G8LD98_STIJA|nr:putative glypican-4 [Apostichopus japonicus]
MIYFCVFLAILAVNKAIVTDRQSCELSGPKEELLVRNGFMMGTEAGSIHLLDNTSVCVDSDAMEIGPQLSCCSRDMERTLISEDERTIERGIASNLMELQTIWGKHSLEFDGFVTDGIEYVRQRIIMKLNSTYSINVGMLDEIDDFFSNMMTYVLTGAISREEIVTSFLDSLYSELISQKTRRKSNKYASCILNVMNQYDQDFLKLHRYYITSIISQPLLDVRAYRIGVKGIREVVGGLEFVPLTETCKDNILRTLVCSYCQGYGANVPPCPRTYCKILKDCTYFHNLLHKRMESFFDPMTLIAANMIQIPFSLMKLSVAIDNALRDFNFVWLRTQYRVESTCGKPRRKLKYFDLIDGLDDPSNVLERDYYNDAKELGNMERFVNMTEKLMKPNFRCESSESNATDYICWSGINLSSSAQDEENPFLFPSSDASPEVANQIRTLKKLAIKLRKATIDGVDTFLTSEEKMKQSEENGHLDGYDSNGDCPYNWGQFNTSCYLKTRMMDFVEARAECLELDGDMVTVQSPEEDAYLTTFVAEEKGAWIGAVRTEGQFRWINGDDWGVYYKPILEGRDTFDCVEVTTHPNGSSLWNTSSCHSRKIGICERQIALRR